MSDEKELKPLKRKHQRVLDEYLKCWKQAEAYQKIYKVSWDSARTLSSRLFADVNFSAHLQQRLNEVHMSADEALKLLADHARGDIGEFLEVTPMGFNLDMATAQQKGITKLIKKIEQKVITISGEKEEKEIITTKIELHDPQSAIEKILRVHEKLPPSDLNIHVTISDD